MKNAVLLSRAEYLVNIGDYIQALSAAQFFSHIDKYVERETISQYDEDEIKIIMNGWYMHHPNNWPPSNKINPFFVSFHMNIRAREKMLTQDSLQYFRKFQPIGCRDIDTVNSLKEKGVDAYFSGCLTLTLGLKYKNTKKEKTCFFVDPYFKIKRNLFDLSGYLLVLLFNYRKISQINRKLNKIFNFKNLLKTACFYRAYSKFFSKEMLVNSEYITQESVEYKDKNDKELLEYAEELVKKYATAQFVVTSRIHCALPCLGLETPVLYVENKQQQETSSCRLSGLTNLFNVIYWDVNSLYYGEDFQSSKISIENIPDNKDSWRHFANNLIDSCQRFSK